MRTTSIIETNNNFYSDTFDKPRCRTPSSFTFPKRTSQMNFDRMNRLNTQRRYALSKKAAYRPLTPHQRATQQKTLFRVVPTRFKVIINLHARPC